MNVVVAGLLALVVSCCGGEQAPPDTTLVISSDPELRAMVAELLPELAARSGLELRDPVRVERRSRAHLERYLEVKLDEEMPPEEEERLTRAYALLGLVPPDLDLRALLLSVYTEQVAGFYDPDSTALFVLDDQPPEDLTTVLVHELVHAVQDQAADLDSLTHPDRGNDRQTAAQAAIEGHATLVMLEQMMERTQGQEVDLSEIPDFGERIAPALQALGSQYPALASAPRVVQESLLFPYLEGAGFVQTLWQAAEGRPAPFGEHLPQSTEQVIHGDVAVAGKAVDEPSTVEVEVVGARVLYQNGLGELETRIFLEDVTGAPPETASGWDGDRYLLLEAPGAGALVWASVWDDTPARDRFVTAVREGLDGLPEGTTVEALVVDGRPAAVLRIGTDAAVRIGIPQS